MRLIAWLIFIVVVGTVANGRIISAISQQLAQLGGAPGGTPEFGLPEVNMPGLIVPVILVILVLVTLYKMARVVPEYQRLVVFRLGRVLPEAKGPGLVLLIPYVDKPRVADLRERFHEIPAQSAITKDNAPVSVDFLIYRRVVDPVASIVAVEDFQGAAEGIAKTTLRSVVGDISLDDVLSRREHMNEVMRDKLDEVTERWGVKVTAVEVREILPPHDIQEAMSRQMSAERNRRAVVTEADGKREAAIAIATGEKQAAILQAEGLRQATILEAEGTRQATILQAEGLAAALAQIDAAAGQVGTNTMGLQYLDAFRTLSRSDSTKWIVPMEITGLLRSFMGGQGGQDGGAPQASP